MTTIIAGGFDNIVPAEEAIRQLREAGVSSDSMCKWRVNPPGMHAVHPMGGDRGRGHRANSGGGGRMAGRARRGHVDRRRMGGLRSRELSASHRWPRRAHAGHAAANFAAVEGIGVRLNSENWCQARLSKVVP